jgi:hypothetical protein
MNQCHGKAINGTHGQVSGKKMQKHRVLRWAVLQHYEMCRTPLLDVTHSLRIACSFASEQNTSDSAYLMVLAIPQISGAITVSVETELQVLRLSSICPPIAIRPHLQEGYLLGDYPDLAEMGQKMQLADYEVDFGRRLIAKFRFHPDKFWQSDPIFPRVPTEALLPNNLDPVLEFASLIREISACD